MYASKLHSLSLVKNLLFADSTLSVAWLGELHPDWSKMLFWSKDLVKGRKNKTSILKPHSHCAGVATVHPDAGQPVYRDAPGHIS